MNGHSEADAFHPSTYIVEELDERNWTLADLAHYAQVGADRIQAVLNGERVTRPIAAGLGQAFGTSAAMWINLQKSYEEKAGQVQ